MNKYHIYEEIGAGSSGLSQVFKGRERLTIEYVAIKRVDKCRLEEVVNEVQLIHKLSSPHVIGFKDWYETTNNLWLILEYCTGGDLLTVLQQDVKEPESSVQLFGIDLMAGLLYIHSHGILHCDLKLSNILLDEFGILKLRGLGHSKFIPFSQSTHPNPAQQQHRLQHMQYAAPELYRPDHGVFSFASDIWSLGCVLVELATGKVFSENAPAPLAVADRKRVADGLRKALDAGNLSHEFRDLALGMLDEDPYKRMQWPELLSHPFWQGCRRPELPVLPTQPAFEALRDIIPPPPPLGGVDEDNQYEDDFESDVSMSSGASNASDVTGDTGSTGLRFTPPSSLDWGGAEGRSKLKRATSNPTFPQQSDGGEGSAGEGPALTLSPPAPDPESLLMHSSDSLVTPIIGNKAIEGAASTPKCRQDQLPFQSPGAPSGIAQLDQKGVEGLLSDAYRYLASRSHDARGKANVLVWLQEAVAASPPIANLLINSSFQPLLLKFVSRQKYALGLRCLAASTLGLIIRHSTSISPPADPSDEGALMKCLAMAAVGDARPRLRRQASAALGELLFYAVSQSKQGAGEPLEVSEEAILSLLKCLREADDPALVHCAAKTLENVLAQADAMTVQTFLRADIAASLGDLALPRSADQCPDQEQPGQLRVTAMAALFHFLSRCAAPSALEGLEPRRKAHRRRLVWRALGWDERDGFSGDGELQSTAHVIVSGLHPSAVAKYHQALLNIINLLLVTCDPSRSRDWLMHEMKAGSRLTFLLTEDSVLDSAVLLAGRGGNPCVRAKAMLALRLIFAARPVVLPTATPVLLATLERTNASFGASSSSNGAAGSGTSSSSASAQRKSQQRYMFRSCIGLCQDMVVMAVEGLRSHSARLRGGGTAVRKQIEEAAEALPHLLCSPLFRRACLGDGELASELSVALREAVDMHLSGATARPSRDLSSLLGIVEALALRAWSLAATVGSDKIMGLLRSLCHLLDSSIVECRAQALALTRALVPALLSLESSNAASSTVVSDLIPRGVRLLRDEEPMPRLMLRLLAESADVWPGMGDALRRGGVLSELVSQLNPPHDDTTSHLCSVLARLVEAGGPGAVELLRLGLSKEIVSVAVSAVSHRRPNDLRPSAQVASAILQLCVQTVHSPRSNADFAPESALAREARLGTLQGLISPLLGASVTWSAGLGEFCSSSADYHGDIKKGLAEYLTLCLTLTVQVFGVRSLHLLCLAKPPAPVRALCVAMESTAVGKGSKVRLLSLLTSATRDPNCRDALAASEVPSLAAKISKGTLGATAEDSGDEGGAGGGGALKQTPGLEALAGELLVFLRQSSH